MDTAPKDGRVIIVYVELQIDPFASSRPDVLFASYLEKEGRWGFFTDLDVDSLVQRGRGTPQRWTDILGDFLLRSDARFESLEVLMTTARGNIAQRRIVDSLSV